MARIGLPMGILIVALLPRVWVIAEPYQTCDLAGLPDAVHHRAGWLWAAENSYAPALPLYARACATVFALLHVPLSEITDRIPIVLISLLQVALTYPLLRRMRFSVGRAIAGMAGCAVLPALVSDAYMPWAHPLFWHVTGMLTILALLAYLDEGRPWMLAATCVALLVHCLSSVWVFAVPILLIVIWIQHRRSESRDLPRISTRTALLIFVLIGAAAVSVTIGCWLMTGQGLIAHLMYKKGRGTGGVFCSQLLRLPSEWTAQFGYLFGIAAAAGLLWSSLRKPDHHRERLLACWCWAALIPILFLANWNRTRPGFYFVEVTYAAGVLGAVGMYALYESLVKRPRWRMAYLGVALLTIAQLTGGMVDDVVCGGTRMRYSGVQTGWASFRPETGVKAAGWYIRAQVPLDSVILLLHTSSGMEIKAGEYYTGRRVLGDCNHTRPMHPILLEAMHQDIDVVVMEAKDEYRLQELPEFERVCTIRRDGKPVRCIYARTARHLAHVDADVNELNHRYNIEYSDRKLPTPLATPAGFEPVWDRYQRVIDSLRSLRNNNVS